MMITYSDFVQTGIFIVVLVNLCYQIYKGKKIAATTAIATADLVRGISIIV